MDTTGGAAAPTAGEPQGGILRKHGRAGRATHGGPRAVRWRPVLVADAEKSSGAGGGAGENVARNPCLTFALALRDLRMWLLSYELVLIPLRFSLAGMVIGSPVLTVLDIFVDICEILLNETIAVRTNLPVLYAAQNGLPPPVRDDDSTTFGAYSTTRMLLDILTIGLLHCGRAVYFLTGDHQLFVYSQFVRTRRVFDLSAHVQALNSNLATNVRFLSSFKFALVLFSVPHWCACLWLCVTSWGPMGAGRVQLPAWPAQIQLEADNPAFEPNAQTYAERYLSGTLMAYSGLGALGYTVMLTRTDEIFLALAIAVVQIVFFGARPSSPPATHLRPPASLAPPQPALAQAHARSRTPRPPSPPVRPPSLPARSLCARHALQLPRAHGREHGGLQGADEGRRRVHPRPPAAAAARRADQRALPVPALQAVVDHRPHICADAQDAADGGGVRAVRARDAGDLGLQRVHAPVPLRHRAAAARALHAAARAPV